ncbi:MAG: UDP-N-acetylmuramoyl-L-alanyl-D-glutamate--2,6-diaminopimelate ligase, partial [Leptospiraceae bacterium]|nr:UDP-N-acetylmuramoyl-L-alanyl-D-glutamate--2,6-diaminopimelate ligase [Leptospiraceae bacterium]
MKLADLIEAMGADVTIRGHVRDTNIDTITDDSREVTSRSIFAVTALSEKHLADALERKPALLIIPRSLLSSLSKDYLREGAVAFGTRPARSRPEWILGSMAGHLYEHPDRSMELVAVTGTNGKTSISQMIYFSWKSQGQPCGVIGTLGARWFDGEKEITLDTGYTTPRSYQLLQLLQQMQRAGIRRVALEASSEALALGRLEGIRISKAVFCGLSMDHLNYHKTMSRYFMAKLHLFALLRRSQGHAIIQDLTDYRISKKPVDSEQPHSLTSRPGSDRAARRLERFLLRSNGSFEIVSEFRPFALNVSVEFNVRNANLAWRASGLNYAKDLFASMSDVPGRMNKIEVGPGIDAIVDYAHTPDALERILEQLRTAGYNKLICVFGCGGDRDRGKRIPMGRAAFTGADVAIVTDDNPRTEDAGEIRAEVLRAATDLPGNSVARVLEMADRREAIRHALELALELQSARLSNAHGSESGATNVDEIKANRANNADEPDESNGNGSIENLRLAVLIAGKGHEDYQIYGREKRHFS